MCCVAIGSRHDTPRGYQTANELPAVRQAAAKKTHASQNVVNTCILGLMPSGRRGGTALTHPTHANAPSGAKLPELT
eukprot:11073378-Heterocapsa_arctica.AAC.1